LAVLLIALRLRRSASFSGAAEIEQSLSKLNELGTVLHIAALPDDERTAGAGVLRARTAHADGVIFRDTRQRAART